MNYTLSYLLYCQSPALFLSAAALLVSYFIRKRRSHIRAALDLILCILFVVSGIVLYYLSMLNDVFTIHDFWQIRVPGWVGICIVAVGIIYSACRSFKRYSDKKQAVKNANRSENARRQELESARQQAYASGMADAMAADSRKVDVIEPSTIASDADAPITLTTEPSEGEKPLQK